MDTLERIGLIGLVPVVAFENINQALPAAKAIFESGIEVIEVTLRTEAGLEAIKLIRENMPEMLVGAGTVLSLQNAKDAIEAGASFIVSPGFSDEVVAYCQKEGVPITPGCVTPTEIGNALEKGVTTLKFFPSSVFGGVKAMSALMGPFKHTGLKFIPTGGINESNLHEYADKSFVHAIGGGWLCSSKDMKVRDFENITKTCKKAVDILLGFELDHTAIIDKEEKLLDIKTHNTDRAMYYLKKRGYVE